MDDLRYQLFSVKGDEMNSTLLILREDTLRLHSVRANYQTAIWKRCLEPVPDIPTPVGHGWITDEAGNLSVIWMTIKPASDDILKLVACSCPKVCKLPQSSFLDTGMEITEMQKLFELKSRSLFSYYELKIT